MTSHYLKQCCPDLLTHICGTRGRSVNLLAHGSVVKIYWICLTSNVVNLVPIYYMKRWWPVVNNDVLYVSNFFAELESKGTAYFFKRVSLILRRGPVCSDFNMLTSNLVAMCADVLQISTRAMQYGIYGGRADEKCYCTHAHTDISNSAPECIFAYIYCWVQNLCNLGATRGHPRSV